MSDTTISAIAWHRGFLLCLQNNGRMMVMDTSYGRRRDLEEHFQSTGISSMLTHRDSIFLTNDKEAFYLTDNFILKPYTHKKRIYGTILFEDSDYLVYSGCAGEFGGSVFFLQKATNRTYSYFATCAAQVLKWGQNYMVCNNLAHISHHSSFLTVHDPTTLYELTEEKLKYTVNWYSSVDSLKDYWQKSPKGKISFYDYPETAMSLLTFPFRDSLYTLFSNDTSTYLAVHQGNTVAYKAGLLNHPIHFHKAQVIRAGSRTIGLLNLTGGSLVAAYWVRGNASAILVANGDQIDVLLSE
ncbi:MAG TPA: hypothetical protein VFR58_17980 [Flavisolibacter sp.]|nr:hypothetical protein [Flavisolibacter sp.]